MARFSNPQNFKGQGLISKQDLGLSAETDVLVAADGKITDEYLPGVTFNNKGTDEDFVMGSNIKFIGNCNVVKDEVTGQLIIRIGDNLNSSTFNMKDGVTDGTASMKRSTTPTDKLTMLSGSQSVWLKNGTDSVTATTAGKIHFDDATKTTFTVNVTANGTTTTTTCGPVTGDGTFGTAPVTLKVSNWAAESKSAEGATGFEANVTFTIDIDELVTVEGPVSFEITMTGTNGGKKFSETVGYIIIDRTTKPTITDVSATLTSATTQKIGGVTHLTAGKVKYSATFNNLIKPASSGTKNSSYGFNNTKNYADDFISKTSTSNSGTITADVDFTTTTGVYTAASHFTNGVTVSGANCNGTTTQYITGLIDDKGTDINGIDVYVETPDATIYTNRLTLASTDGNETSYSNAEAPGSEDLMVYHGQAQIPVTTDFSTFFGNSGYTKLTIGNGDRAILTKVPVYAAASQCTLTIRGSNLKDSIKGIFVSSSLASLPNDSALVLSTAGGIKDGAAADNNDSATRTIKLTYLGTGKMPLTTAGAYVKIVLASGSTAKISSIAIA